MISRQHSVIRRRSPILAATLFTVLVLWPRLLGTAVNLSLRLVLLVVIVAAFWW